MSLFAWPDGCAAAVSLTFDVDAESVFLGQGLGESASLSAFSERRFGITRGLPRILEFLAAREIRGTFYTPGWTADRYPDAIRAIVDGGHELAHHGYLHRPPNLLDAAGQREEIERGTEALERIAGERPRGYRSPSWELTEETLALLAEAGFAYDSSRMGDDRPYVENVGGVPLVELPVHWSLDDFPYYSWQEANRGPMSDPATVSAIWLSEFRGTLAEGGHVTYTAHPEVSGRRSRFEALKALVDEIQAAGGVWFATHEEVGEIVRAAHGQPTSTEAG